MKKIPKKRPPTAEQLARMAEQGKDISNYFTGGKMVYPDVQRVNVDFSKNMLEELDATARDLNISRQAVIKTFVRQALNQHYMSRQAQHQAKPK